jgi:hypothetical protein
MSNISDTDSDADSYDDESDNPDDWCYGCGCNISGTTNFIFCEENDSFYCTECYENEVWIE